MKKLFALALVSALSFTALSQNLLGMQTPQGTVAADDAGTVVTEKRILEEDAQSTVRRLWENTKTFGSQVLWLSGAPSRKINAGIAYTYAYATGIRALAKKYALVLDDTTVDATNAVAKWEAAGFEGTLDIYTKLNRLFQQNGYDTKLNMMIELITDSEKSVRCTIARNPLTTLGVATILATQVYDLSDGTWDTPAHAAPYFNMIKSLFVSKTDETGTPAVNETRPVNMTNTVVQVIEPVVEAAKCLANETRPVDMCPNTVVQVVEPVVKAAAKSVGDIIVGQSFSASDLTPELRAAIEGQGYGFVDVSSWLRGKRFIVTNK